MSGHNKWSKTKNKKAITDAYKAKVFSKLVRFITVESKKAKGDVNSPGLRAAIEKAKAENVPSDNIERAVRKGAGAEAGDMEQITYEAYGPGGCALIIEALTDNRNKAVQEIKHILSKNGYELAAQGSAQWAFDKSPTSSWTPKMATQISEEDGVKLNDLINELEEMMKSKKSIPMQSNIILGVDPGYGRIGIAVVDSNNRRPILIHSECFETSGTLPHPERLALLAQKILEVIEEFKPEKLAIESLLFSKNQKTALKVAEARGIILGEAARKNVVVCEFNPNTVKLAITGYGKSDKKRIIWMLDKTLGIKHKIKHDDEYDAIAIAIACAVSDKLST